MNQSTYPSAATEVLISGAGAAGLTLAIELARRNIAFRLIEKSSSPFQGSRGKGLQPRTLEIFEDMGVVDQILAKGGAYPTMRSYGPEGYIDSETIEVSAPHPSEPYAAPLMLPQFLTEAALRARLGQLGHAVEYDCELTAFRQDETGVAAQIRRPSGEETVRARYLIGTDGGRSFVRHVLEIGFPGETLQVRAVVADMVLEGLSREFWHRWSPSPTRSVSLCPLRGTELFQLQAPIPMEADPDLSADGLTRFITERTGRNDIVVRKVIWSSAYTMNARLADQYRVGNVFLVGDAAHIHPPTGGQGLNTSAQDAYNLGWKLAAVLQGAPAALLDTYEAERRPVAADMLGLSTRLLSAFQARSDVKRGRDTQQLDLGYPDSPLNLEFPPRAAGVRAGDRAPDAPCHAGNGQATRLFTLLRGPQWTLLSYEPANNSPVATRDGLRVMRVGQGGDIVDIGGYLREHYSLTPGDQVLVRPDGYVAAIVSSAGLDKLELLLNGVLPASNV